MRARSLDAVPLQHLKQRASRDPEHFCGIRAIATYELERSQDHHALHLKEREHSIRDLTIDLRVLRLLPTRCGEELERGVVEHGLEWAAQPARALDRMT